MPKSKDGTAARLGSGASAFERRRMSAAGTFPTLGKIVPFSERIAIDSARSRSLMSAARDVGDRAFVGASAYDEDGAC